MSRSRKTPDDTGATSPMEEELVVPPSDPEVVPPESIPEQDQAPVTPEPTADVSTAPEPEPEPVDDGLFAVMNRDGEVIRIAHANIPDHARLGWRLVE